MSDFLKHKRIAKLLIEGFAKRLVYVGNERNPPNLELMRTGISIEKKFKELTKNVPERLRVEILLVFTKYVIWRLGKVLSPERRNQLIRRYANEPLEKLRNSLKDGEEAKNSPNNRGKVNNPNDEHAVFGWITFFGHEIVHEILHEGSLEYFERQNEDSKNLSGQVSTDLEVEYIYDFFETIAQVFNTGEDWMVDDAFLWDTFKYNLIKFFRKWLEKNKFFNELYENKFFTDDDFEKAYDRFAKAIDRIGEFSSMNKIFEKFWNLYMKPYVRDVVKEDSLFKGSVKTKFRYASELPISFLYESIAKSLMGRVDKVFKDRFVITVDILSKVRQMLDEWDKIDLRMNEIIGKIKKMVMARYSIKHEAKPKSAQKKSAQKKSAQKKSAQKKSAQKKKMGSKR